MTELNYDVIIVGYGPTGATLANLLGQSGVKTLILEKAVHIYPLPRAVHFDDETMRIFQSTGIAEELTECVRINPGMRFVDKDHKLLLDWPRPPGIGKHGWHSSYRFHQPELEQLLRRSVERETNITTSTNSVVTQVVGEANGCQVTYQTAMHNHEQTVSASFVIGCDGANSIVRQSMQTDYLDLGFNERWLVVDTRLTRPKPELGDHTIQYCIPSETATYVRCPGDRRRWEMALDPAMDNATATNTTNVRRLLSRWIQPEDAIVERSAIYTFRSAIARDWRRGRLFLAGDAAHLTPPFMGQGMCCGIRDAANLGWKIAHCVANGVDESLLNSYQSERYQHTRAYIETAMELGRLLNTCTTGETLRSALQSSDGAVKMKSIAPRLGSGLTAGDALLSGQLFPQPSLKNGSRLDDVCGYSPVLLINSDFWHKYNISCKIKPQFVVLESSNEPAIARALAERGTQAIVLRPDKHILGSANSLQQLQKLLLHSACSR